MDVSMVIGIAVCMLMLIQLCAVKKDKNVLVLIMGAAVILICTIRFATDFTILNGCLLAIFGFLQGNILTNEVIRILNEGESAWRKNEMKKQKWGIISDLVRALSNTSNNRINLNDTEQEFALQDIANIMDTMIINKCSFEKAVKIKRENDECFAQWLKQALEAIR